MAHFAKLDENNVVIQVIVVDNKDTADASGVEKEYIGAAFCERLLGGTPYRKNYAGLGYTYDAARDAFIPPKPSNDATLDEATCQWIVPDSIGADSVGADSL